jgi:hypothetical protein
MWTVIIVQLITIFVLVCVCLILLSQLQEARRNLEIQETVKSIENHYLT